MLLNFAYKNNFTSHLGIMFNSKLINSLKILSAKEFEGIEELLETNLLLKGSYKHECVSLFAFLKHYFPDFQHRDLEKDVVLKHLYPSGAKINRLEKAMTALLHIVEYYIIHFLKKDKFLEVSNQLTLASFYRERKQFARSEAAYKKAISSLDDSKETIDTEYFYWKSLLAEEAVAFDDIRGELNKEHILEKFDRMNEYAVLKLLEQLCKTVLKRSYFEAHELAFFEKLNEIIDSQPICQSNILIRLHQLELKMFCAYLEDKFVFLYEDYLRVFLENSHLFDTKIVYSFAARERTCLVYRYTKQPNEQNLRYLFDTYKRHLDNGALLLNGRIHSSAAINIMNYSLRLDERSWLRVFLDKWKEKLGAHDDNNEEVRRFCYAMYYFAEKQFPQAEDNILPHYENILLLLITRRLKIKIHFERNEFNRMFHEIDAFKIYLFRNVKTKKGLPNAHFEWNNNFITILKKIYALKFKKNKNDKQRLIERIQTSHCSDKEWLLDKAHAIL